MGRQNEKQIRRVKEELQKYRNKPEINDTSKQIFRLYTEKNELGGNVFDRFEQYSDEKKRRTKEGEKKHQQEHYPFHPTISSTSRMIMHVKDNCNELSKNKHGASYSEIRVKRDMSSTHLQTSNKKNSYSRSNFDSPVLISHFG